MVLPVNPEKNSRMIFQDVIDKIHAQIQWIANTKRIHPKTLEKWNLILAELEEVHDTREKYITTIKNENYDLIHENHLLQDKIIRLEAICLIHGIHDINMYLSKETASLVDLATHAIQEGWTQKPVTLTRWTINPETTQA